MDASGSLQSSTGIRVRSLLVRFYENLFRSASAGASGASSSKDGQRGALSRAIAGLGYDFLQLELTPDHEGPIQAQLLRHKDSPSGRAILKSLLYHCREQMSSKDQRIQRNALATLYSVFFVVLHHSVPRSRPLDSLELIVREGKAAEFCRSVLRSACKVLCDDVAPAETVSRALKLLLSCASAAINLHQNPLLELFFTEKVFNVLMRQLTIKATAADAKADTKLEREAKKIPSLFNQVKMLVLVAPLVHFKRYDSHNTGLEVLTRRLSSQQLRSFNAALSSLLRLCQSQFADLPPRSSKQQTAANGSGYASSAVAGLRSGLGAIVGLFGQLFEPVNTPTLVRRRGVAVGQGPATGVSAPIATTEQCFKKTRHCLCNLAFFLLYIMLTENKKYIIRLAKISRIPQRKSDKKGANGTSSGPATDKSTTCGKDRVPVVPTEPARVIEMCLSLASVVLQQPLGPRALVSIQLCLAVIHRMSQDTPSNVLLFSTNLPSNVLVYKRNASAPELDPTASDYEIKTRRFKSGKWERGDAKMPLAVSLFRVATRYLRIHLHKLHRLSDEVVLSFAVLLDALYRHLSYHLFVGVQDATVFMAPCYLNLSKILIKICVMCAKSTKLDNKSTPSRPARPSAGTPPPILQLLYQGAHFLHLLVCVRSKIFSENQTQSFLYELSRNARALEGIPSRVKWAPVVAEEVHSVATIARRLARVRAGRREDAADESTSTLTPSNDPPESGAVTKSQDDDAKTSEGDKAESKNAAMQNTAALTVEMARERVAQAEKDLNVVPLQPTRQVRESAVFGAKSDKRFFNNLVNTVLQDFANLYLCGSHFVSSITAQEERQWREEELRDPPTPSTSTKAKVSKDVGDGAADGGQGAAVVRPGTLRQVPR